MKNVNIGGAVKILYTANKTEWARHMSNHDFILVYEKFEKYPVYSEVNYPLLNEIIRSKYLTIIKAYGDEIEIKIKELINLGYPYLIVNPLF